MSNGPRLRTVVADTSALVSLVVPRADASYDTDIAPDPFQYLLTACDVSVPTEVVANLRDIAQYQGRFLIVASDFENFAFLATCSVANDCI